MRTADFQTELAPNGQIAVPPEVASQVPPGEKIQVVLQWGPSDDEEWKATGHRAFAASYDAGDSVYEALAGDDPTP